MREVEAAHHDEPVRDGDTIAFARDVLRFDLPGESDEDDLVLVIREDHGVGPHGRVSESAIAMASWICAQYQQMFVSVHAAQQDHRPTTILELGSGCGLPGLVLAALGATVTLSDQKGALANLTHNVQLNARLFQGRAPPSVVRVDWRKPTAMVPHWPMSASAMAPLRSFDFVVATEVMDNDDGEDAVAPLINTIEAWLRHREITHGHSPHEVAASGGGGGGGGGGTFFLLERQLGPSLDRFVRALNKAQDDDQQTDAGTLGRGLMLLDKVGLELGASSTGEPMRLYQVRWSAESAEMQRRKPAHLALSPALERMIGSSDTVWHQVGFSCSGAAVYRLDRPPELVPWAYLKIAPAGALAADVRAMQWLERGGATTARVLHYEECGSGGSDDVLLMSPLVGITGIDPVALARPRALTTHFARALRALHDNSRLLPPTTDVTDGFDMRLAARLAAKEQAARAGTFEPKRVAAIKHHLANAPVDVETDVVFTHGDYCLPNVVFRVTDYGEADDNDDDAKALEVVGLIDVGGAGVADRYRDLASAVWSLRFNGLGDHVGQFLSAYGIPCGTIDQAKLDWYILHKIT